MNKEEMNISPTTIFALNMMLDKCKDGYIAKLPNMTIKYEGEAETSRAEIFTIIRKED